MQTCKIMHGWLPVSHMRHHITGVNQCPRCKCTDETIDHFLKCPHPSITAQRKIVLAQMRLNGIKQKIPQNVLTAITQTLATHTGVGQHIDYKYNPEITTALEYQVQIGVGMLARGFLTKQWILAIHPSRNPPRIMVRLQRLIWMDFFEPLWKNRNDLLRHTVNLYTQEDDGKLTDIITHFCENRHTLLSHHDVHLADAIDLSTLHIMPTNQKREWVRHFETAKEAYDKERQRTRQLTILDYLTPLSKPKCLRPKQRRKYQPTPTPQHNPSRPPNNVNTMRRHTYTPIPTRTNNNTPSTTNLRHTLAPPRPPKPR